MASVESVVMKVLILAIESRSSRWVGSIRPIESRKASAVEVLCHDSRETLLSSARAAVSGDRH